MKHSFAKEDVKKTIEAVCQKTLENADTLKAYDLQLEEKFSGSARSVRAQLQSCRKRH